MILKNIPARTAATPGYRRKRAKAIISAAKKAAREKQLEDEKNNPEPPSFGAQVDGDGDTDDDGSKDTRRRKKKKKDKKRKDAKDPSVPMRVSHILYRPYFSWAIRRNPAQLRGPKGSVIEEIPGALPRLLIKGDYEIGSDNEDLDDLPKALTKQYSKFEKLGQPKDEEFLWYADKFAIQKATKTWKMYRFTENWAFIEVFYRKIKVIYLIIIISGCYENAQIWKEVLSKS